MRMAQAEFKGAAPGTDRLVKDGTRKQGLANEASGRKYAATVAVCSATFPRRRPLRILRMSCSDSLAPCAGRCQPFGPGGVGGLGGATTGKLPPEGSMGGQGPETHPDSPWVV